MQGLAMSLPIYYNYRGEKSVRSCACTEKRNMEVEGARCNQKQEYKLDEKGICLLSYKFDDHVFFCHGVVVYL